MNKAPSLIMHVDLNSCFATIEQQAHVTLRGRPVGIVNRRTKNTMLVTASYEAKSLGVTIGTSAKEAKFLAPKIVLLESDPPKYRFVYHRLLDIMNDYSAHVRMKSIDEGVIDFSESPIHLQENIARIGLEIKQRLKAEVGSAMRCNVGIGPNRFWAKTAAGLNKPDGFDVITHQTMRQVLAGLKLTDLTGINQRFAARLQAVGIMTPLEFFDADQLTLEKMVFKSVVGRQWYQRLRGFEVDKTDHPTRSIGRQYVLEGYRLPRNEVVNRLRHLAEEVGGRLRGQGLVARGVSVFADSYESGCWRSRHMASLPFFSDQAIFRLANQQLSRLYGDIKAIGVSCYQLAPNRDLQFSLFGDDSVQCYGLMEAVDEINDRYGRRTIFTAEALKSNDFVMQKIPFGSTRYL